MNQFHTDQLIMDYLIAARDKDQDTKIRHLERVVRVLWHKVQQLEDRLTAKNGQIVLQAGDASLILKKDGTVEIKGRDINVNGSGHVNVRASSDLTLKGARISQN